jgi:cytochrome c
MKVLLALVAIATSAVASPAMANADLAQKKNCMACHAIAAKYAGQKDATDNLAAKIVKGGAGAWGQVPMPANPQVSEAEAKQLAAWVLTVK